MAGSLRHRSTHRPQLPRMRVHRARSCSAPGDRSGASSTWWRSRRRGRGCICGTRAGRGDNSKACGRRRNGTVVCWMSDLSTPATAKVTSVAGVTMWSPWMRAPCNARGRVMDDVRRIEQVPEASGAINLSRSVGAEASSSVVRSPWCGARARRSRRRHADRLRLGTCLWAAQGRTGRLLGSRDDLGDGMGSERPDPGHRRRPDAVDEAGSRGAHEASYSRELVARVGCRRRGFW
jgi:hypothetical protein